MAGRLGTRLLFYEVFKTFLMFPNFPSLANSEVTRIYHGYK